MEAEFLMCNFTKCRKPIVNEAWVTACSHIFCAEDGNRELNKMLICPACNTKLEGKYDVVKVDTNPSDAYKAIVLAGLNPDIIMEVTQRAMSFWTYQVQQELSLKENQFQKSSEQFCQIEEFYKQDSDKWQMKFNQMSKELETTKAEVINQKQRSAELSEKLMEKSRQLQKVQTMYESMRRRNISPNNFAANRDRDHVPGQRSFELVMTTPNLHKERTSLSTFDRRSHSIDNRPDGGSNFLANFESANDDSFRMRMPASRHQPQYMDAPENNDNAYLFDGHEERRN